MNREQHLFANMLFIRLVEEGIARRYQQQQMRCPTHLSIGQEATPVGVSDWLNKDDKAYSSHRAHAHYLAKGGDLNALIAELHGKVSGCTAGRGGSMHLCDMNVGFMASTAIVGNSIPLAVGHALSMKTRNEASIAVAYFGDGATEEGAFYEAMNFAALKKLPVLFVCENNLYSVYSPLHVRQPQGRDITGLSQSIGVSAMRLDGNDVIAVSDAMHSIKPKLLAGEGPYLLECMTYRHREHCGPNFDDHLGYRNEQEVLDWQAKDPLHLFRQQFSDKSQLAAFEQQKTSEYLSAIESAFEKAKSDDFPEISTRTDKVYA